MDDHVVNRGTRGRAACAFLYLASDVSGFLFWLDAVRQQSAEGVINLSVRLNDEINSWPLLGRAVDGCMVGQLPCHVRRGEDLFSLHHGVSSSAGVMRLSI